jgi:hypothetical protein
MRKQSFPGCRSAGMRSATSVSAETRLRFLGAACLWFFTANFGGISSGCSRAREREPNQAGPANPPAPPSYRATIVEFTRGRYKTLTYDYTPNEILVVKHSINGKPDKVLLRRKTTQAEDQILSRYCATFPFASMNDSYADEKMEGERQREFYVEWSDSRKTIKSSYSVPPQLRELEQVIEQLLPRDRASWNEPY